MMIEKNCMVEITKPPPIKKAETFMESEERNQMKNKISKSAIEKAKGLLNVN